MIHLMANCSLSVGKIQSETTIDCYLTLSLETVKQQKSETINVFFCILYVNLDRWNCE